jgi:hypothetical protein
MNPSMSRRRFALLGLAAPVLAVSASASHAGLLEALFTPKARLWERWISHDPQSPTTVSHDAWHGFLNAYLRQWADGTTRVAYAAVTLDDRASLQAYLNQLATVRVSALNRDERRAYWINLYTVLTIRVVLNAYPVASIRDITLSRGLLGQGPWDAKLVALEGEALSLNDIEHRILRPIWRDPRIHYALNCASIGCPNLAHSAFTAANLETLLDAGARAYVNHSRGAEFDLRLGGQRSRDFSRSAVFFYRPKCWSSATTCAHPPPLHEEPDNCRPPSKARERNPWPLERQASATSHISTFLGKLRDELQAGRPVRLVEYDGVGEPRLHAAAEHILVETIEHEWRERVLQHAVCRSVDANDCWLTTVEEASGTAHNTMMPFGVAQWIIKT